MTNQEIFDAAIESANVYVTDGDGGIENVNALARMVGYNESYTSPLEQLLCDNYGCIQAIFDWVRKNLSDEQTKELMGFLPKCSDDDFEEFFNGYAECALWVSSDDKDCPLDKNYTIDDIPEDVRQRMESDCREFLKKAGQLIPAIEAEQAGHDFWLTRNGHGAGFWDGDWHNGEELSKIVKEFGECCLSASDGKIFMLMAC